MFSEHRDILTDFPLKGRVSIFRGRQLIHRSQGTYARCFYLSVAVGKGIQFCNNASHFMNLYVQANQLCLRIFFSKESQEAATSTFAFRTLPFTFWGPHGAQTGRQS